MESVNLVAYKLFRIRQDGTLGSLFINRRAVIPSGLWLTAEAHPTPGYSVRPGWHCVAAPFAPHLSLKGRQWFEVEIEDYEEHRRPTKQGGLWYVANRIKVIGP